MVNMNLLTNPINWLIIAVMVLLPLTAVVLCKYFNITIEE